MYLKVRATEKFPNTLHIARTWMAVIDERLAEIRAERNGRVGVNPTDSQRDLSDGYSERRLPTLDELVSPSGWIQGSGADDGSASPFDGGHPKHASPAAAFQRFPPLIALRKKCLRCSMFIICK